MGIWHVWHYNDLNTLQSLHTSFRQIFEPAQTETNVVVIVIEAERALRCDFLLAEKVRNANDEGSSWKSTANKTNTHVRDAKYLLFKMPVITSIKKNETNTKRTGIKFNGVQEIT
jgi:hypothetical protein